MGIVLQQGFVESIPYRGTPRSVSLAGWTRQATNKPSDGCGEIVEGRHLDLQDWIIFCMMCAPRGDREATASA